MHGATNRAVLLDEESTESTVKTWRATLQVVKTMSPKFVLLENVDASKAREFLHRSDPTSSTSTSQLSEQHTFAEVPKP